MLTSPNTKKDPPWFASHMENHYALSVVGSVIYIICNNLLFVNSNFNQIAPIIRKN